MHKVTLALLVLVSVATASSLPGSNSRQKRQIFDTIDFNSGYKNARIPARQNSLEPRSNKGYNYDPPTTGAQTYLPPTNKPKSTPGPKYIIPTRGSTTTRSTTYRSLGTFPPYTGTYPTYKSSSYKPYKYTGTYPPPPSTFKPLVTTSTTKRPVVGYEYTKPSNGFSVEEVYNSRR